jgi:hypothetical protein
MAPQRTWSFSLEVEQWFAEAALVHGTKPPLQFQAELAPSKFMPIVFLLVILLSLAIPIGASAVFAWTEIHYIFGIAVAAAGATLFYLVIIKTMKSEIDQFHRARALYAKLNTSN